MNINLYLNDDFTRGCKDYHYLVSNLYPARSVLKLVGDRYKLSGDQRTVMYRGISSPEKSALRAAKLQPMQKGQNIIIDGYNVLITLLNYRLGKILFISTDGILRDAGSLHGKLRVETRLTETVELLVGFLAEKKPAHTLIYLDSPVSGSEQHADLIVNSLAKHGIEGNCILAKSADQVIKQHNSGVLATSDTLIIEKTDLPLVDLPRGILESRYKAGFLKLSEFMGI